MLYYNKSISATLKSLGATSSGLTNADVVNRQQKYGLNIVQVKTEPLWRKLIEPFKDIFMLVLGAAAVISLLHGDTLDAVIIIAIMVINAVVYYVQRFSTERVLRSLQKHSAQQVSVVRDGSTIEIDSSQLVPGDILHLSEGDKVPADGRLIEGSNVRTDEAMLTGESEPINKHVEALSGLKEVYEQANILFQGSFLVSGDATLVIIATGNETEFGQIAELSSRPNTESPVQQKIDKLVGQIVAVVVGMSIVAFTLAILRGMPLAESLSFVMALAVSAVPEGLPVAISVILVLGMRRMAVRHALVRNMRAIETIGALTTIATDKTGTLTKNKLEIQTFWHPDDVTVAKFSKSLINAVMSTGTMHDPLDVSIAEYASREKILASATVPTASLPFDQSVAMSGNLHKDKDAFVLYVKGAPEHILAKSDLTENEREEATAKLHELTSSGYRVIALASTSLTKPIHKFSELKSSVSFDFNGFIAISDSLRPEAKRAIATARAAGVTVRMITGDHFETAYHIGRELGMVTSRDQVFDSRKMNVMTDDELSETVNNSIIFSRVIPEHKFRILALLKQNNITAMTGDGVNDVPALTNAHVGVTMGSGAQIAKDAGDIILLDDNFKSIIDAMKEGRTIISNIGRMLAYLLATNAGEALTMIGALIAGMPVPLAPVQILWVNLVTDTSMVIPLGLEPGEKDVMKTKPKHPNAPLLTKQIVIRMVLVALSMAGTVLVFYASFSSLYGHEYARTIAFIAIVVMQWSNAFNARSDYESIFSRLRVMNHKFYIGLAVAMGLQYLVIFGPLQSLLHVTTVSIGDMIYTSIIAFIIPIVIVEVHKYICRKNKLA